VDECIQPGSLGVNISLAKEVAAIGFDEIQFDYVRFPGRAGNIFLSADDSEDTRIGG
jgi:hypothetical protein